MPLQKLQFRPGINRELTSYNNEGGWFACDRIRFRFGSPESIGGWDNYMSESFLGSCRNLKIWTSVDGTNFVFLGTNKKTYIESGNVLTDITPVGSAIAAGTITFSATASDATITVSHTSHGLQTGDFVVIANAASLGGNITAAVLNQEYEVTKVDANSYTFEAREVATIISITTDGVIGGTPVLANGSDTGNGGASTTADYLLATGLDSTVPGTGWASGTWSRGTWSSSSSSTGLTSQLRIWFSDTFGEDLVANIMDGAIYYWDKSLKFEQPDPRMVTLASLSSDSTCPTLAHQVLVSDVDRHVMALGCDAENDIGTQDPLLIRWSDQENPLVWESTATNTAGSLRLGSGNAIVAAAETRQQTLVLTDTAAYAVQFLGPPYTFGATLVSDNSTIAGPLAMASVDDTVFWMGAAEFYVYTGTVRKLQCPLREFVFSDFNVAQREKVTAALNSAFGEIWWFYASAGATENDRYVVFNYEQQIWYYGTLPRLAWTDRGIKNFPIAASVDGHLYSHEVGSTDGSTEPASSINAFVQSADLDIGDGNNFFFIRRLLPDVTFRDTTSSPATVIMTLKGKRFPGNDYTNTEAETITRSVSVSANVIEQYTEQVHVRVRGRLFSLRVESTEAGTAWRLGTPLIDIRPDGRQ